MAWTINAEVSSSFDNYETYEEAEEAFRDDYWCADLLEYERGVFFDLKQIYKTFFEAKTPEEFYNKFSEAVCEEERQIIAQYIEEVPDGEEEEE